jgi:hypothetical protein
MLAKIGFWAFIIGLLLALIGGLVAPNNATVVVILVILGLIVGLLNISGKETMLFLVATIALIVAAGAFAPLSIGSIGDKLDDMVRLVATFMAPAAVVASIKAIWAVGKPGGE